MGAHDVRRRDDSRDPHVPTTTLPARHGDGGCPDDAVATHVPPRSGDDRAVDALREVPGRLLRPDARRSVRGRSGDSAVRAPRTVPRRGDRGPRRHGGRRDLPARNRLDSTERLRCASPRESPGTARLGLRSARRSPGPRHDLRAPRLGAESHPGVPAFSRRAHGASGGASVHEPARAATVHGPGLLEARGVPVRARPARAGDRPGDHAQPDPPLPRLVPAAPAGPLVAPRSVGDVARGLRGAASRMDPSGRSRRRRALDPEGETTCSSESLPIC